MTPGERAPNPHHALCERRLDFDGECLSPCYRAMGSESGTDRTGDGGGAATTKRESPNVLLSPAVIGDPQASTWGPTDEWQEAQGIRGRGDRTARRPWGQMGSPRGRGAEASRRLLDDRGLYPRGEEASLRGRIELNSKRFGDSSTAFSSGSSAVQDRSDVDALRCPVNAEPELRYWPTMSITWERGNPMPVYAWPDRLALEPWMLIPTIDPLRSARKFRASQGAGGCAEVVRRFLLCARGSPAGGWMVAFQVRDPPQARLARVDSPAADILSCTNIRGSFEPLMSKRHLVQPGDHIAKLAAKAGFLTLDAIWTHPENAELRKTRPSPQILAPGDVVFIPDRVPGEKSASTGRVHQFVLRRTSLEVLIVLLDRRFQPRPGIACDLVLDGGGACSVTDAFGVLRASLPPTAETGRGGGEPEQPFKVLVGWLDPQDTLSGARARLNNLGYDAGERDDPADADLRSAIEEFQCDHGIPVTGELDAATTSLLAQRHGC